MAVCSFVLLDNDEAFENKLSESNSEFKVVDKDVVVFGVFDEAVYDVLVDKLFVEGIAVVEAINPLTMAVVVDDDAAIVVKGQVTIFDQLHEIVLMS